MSPQTSLRLSKVVHTIGWAFFAGSIVAIPVRTWRDELGWSALLIAIVLVEVVVIRVNRWRCPLTDVAVRHTMTGGTTSTSISLLWLARDNQQLFGTLYGASLISTAAKCQHWLP